MSETTGAYNRILRPLFTGRGRVHQRHIDIPVHGSCSRCHHFHINCLVPHDTTTHTRVRCEQCGHQMFGLGRTTTQYTLASVNTGTMIIPRECVEEQPRQAGSQGETVAVQDAHDASLHFPSPGHQLSFPANRTAESPEQPQQEHLQEPRRHTMRNRLKRWCSRPRQWSFSLRAMVQRLSNTARGARPPAGPAPNNTNNNSVSTSSPPSISETPPGDTAGEASGSVTRPEPPSVSHQMNQPGQPTREQLRILRHEKTKQRERELRSQCLCDHNCFCRREGSPASNVAYVGSESHTRSPTQIEGTRSPPQLDVSGPTFSGGSPETNGTPPSQDISRETTLSHIGDQFNEPRPSSPDTLALTAENSQRRSRSSQTPTIDTNGSSITLSGRTTYSTTRNVRQRLPAIAYNETSSHIPAERGMAGAFESNRDGLASAGLTVGAIRREAIVEPNSVSPSRASSGSSPRHESHVDHGSNAEETSLQVDGIASEHTAEEESEEDTPTR